MASYLSIPPINTIVIWSLRLDTTEASFASQQWTTKAIPPPTRQEDRNWVSLLSALGTLCPLNASSSHPAVSATRRMGAGRAREAGRRGGAGRGHCGGAKLVPRLTERGMLRGADGAARSPADWLPSPAFLPAPVRALSGGGPGMVS